MLSGFLLGIIISLVVFMVLPTLLGSEQTEQEVKSAPETRAIVKTEKELVISEPVTELIKLFVSNRKDFYYNKRKVGNEQFRTIQHTIKFKPLNISVIFDTHTDYTTTPYMHSQGDFVLTEDEVKCISKLLLKHKNKINRVSSIKQIREDRLKRVKTIRLLEGYRNVT